VQLGIFAKTFVRPTVEEVFDAVAGHGLRCLQFNFACAGLPSLPDQIAPALLDRVRKAAAERRLTLAAVSATYNMIHPDPKQRRAGRRQLDVIAGTCARLETRLVTLCTGTRDPQDMWRHHPDNDSPEAWRDLRTALHKALTTADKHDITLGVEPETANVVNSARKARRLLDDLKSPRLKIILDPANLFHRHDLPRMRDVLDEAFDLLAGDIVLAHAKELGGDGHAGARALGTGVLDWEYYLSLLRRANFSGPIIMHGYAEREVEASTAFLRSTLQKVACGN
jgi:sugar phosphate isomerase/epimerase